MHISAFRRTATPCSRLAARARRCSGGHHIPGVPFPFGANGIAYYPDALYVVNTERGIVVRVPVLPSGAPGPIEIAAHVAEPYPTNPPVTPGADGIALDTHGNFYLAMPSHNVVVRMSSDGQSWQTLATATNQLDVPASLAFGTSEAARTNLFVTSLAMFPGGAGPSLVKIDTGMPGLPVPPALAAPGSWTGKAPMPRALDAHASCEVDGILYVIGGHKDPRIYTQLPTLFAYDPKTDRWTRKANIPTGSLSSVMTAFSVADGVVCLFGGEISASAGGYDLSLAYDPVQDKCSAKRKLPMKCEAAAAATIDGKVYHTGGASGDPGNYPGAVYYDSLWVFDP